MSGTLSRSNDRWPDPWVLEVLRAEGRYDDADRPLLDRVPQRTLWQAAVAAGLATDGWLLEAVARRYGLATTRLEDVDPGAAALLNETFVRTRRAVPVGTRGRVLLLAASDPLPMELERLAGFAAGCRVEAVLASPDDIDRAIERLYPTGGTVARMVSTLSGGAGGQPVQAPEVDVVRLTDAIVVDACHRRAGQIHLKGDAEGMVVHYQVDGLLHDAVRLPPAAVQPLLAHLKRLGGMDVAESLRLQEGRATATVDGRPVELRITAVPAGRRGEKVVVQLGDPMAAASSFEELGFSLPERVRIERMMAAEEGLLLVAGPPVSGRTTTLYAALGHGAAELGTVVTVEDPIEYRIPGATQVQINERVGLTFAHALRTTLRQDPHTVMVGELRDLETADLAVEVSRNWHRVHAAVAAPTAPAAIVRLLAMGVDPRALAGALRGVVAQRLLRRVCTACREPVEQDALPAAQRAWIAETPVLQLYRAVGCPRCQGTGYYGRMVVAEVAMVTATIAGAIERRAGLEELTELCGAAGMLSLWESGLARVGEGSTTLEELAATVPPPGADGVAHMESPVRRRMVRRALESILTHVPQDGAPAACIVPVPPRPVGANLSEVDRPLILLVEDDRAVRKVLRMGLEREGFRVEDVPDGRAAIRYLRHHEPRAVVLDLTLPRVDGIGVLQAMRDGVIPPVPVLVLTGQDDPEIAAWTVELGAADFVSKPVPPRALGVRIRALLARTPAALAG